jgi:hypothetical protein
VQWTAEFGRCSILDALGPMASRRPNFVKGSGCMELAPAFDPSGSAQKRQQAGRTPNASRQRYRQQSNRRFLRCVEKPCVTLWRVIKYCRKSGAIEFLKSIQRFCSNLQ